MIQQAIVLILVIGAAAFIGKRFYDNISHKKISEGCDKCEPDKT